MSRTIVAVNAHPDDEALLMSGTLAKAAAAGHRVVLVVATDGDLGMTSAEFRSANGPALADRRLTELQASAEALGAARVDYLGYGDSGMDGPIPPDINGRTRLLRADVHEAAERLATILRAEQADVLIGYDANGGYGHRDHVRVHEMARLAAAAAGTPWLLEATIPRDLLARTVEIVAKVYRFPPSFDVTSFRRAFSSAEQITHRVRVGRCVAAKRASMAAHRSQAAADGGADRTLAMFLRLPDPIFGWVFGREWYVDATGFAPGEVVPPRRDRCSQGRAGNLVPDVFADR
ncbi:PIG-L deacetylase family protein [Austwickia sp. TVS 96-490-7B]|uniref:PIG-L deacetylase family protein n=1 Tax=Austwickia sp. TVS 96-490-7B TaxID=2830843 RepID=UPI001C5A41F7|nr:PIG-L deacetylase family protein [Austwickia sp. TVS 96-490-7B]